MHAVDGQSAVAEAVQGLKHEAIAAEGDDDVRILRRHRAIARHQAFPRRFRLGRLAGNEGDLVEEAGRVAHRCGGLVGIRR